MIKSIALFPILLFSLTSLSFGQEEKKEKEKKEFDDTKYFRDVSDLVAVHGNGFQLQLGNDIERSAEEDSRYSEESITVPDIIARYAFNDVWGLQGNLGYNVSNTLFNDEVISRDDGINELALGGVFVLDPEKEILIFKEFSFNLDGFIPLDDVQDYGTRVNVNWTTIFKDTRQFELDYVFGTSYFEGGKWGGNYDISMDLYLSKAVLIEIGNEGEWSWVGEHSDFESNADIDFALLSKYAYQFNMFYTKGLNHDLDLMGIKMIVTFDRNRQE